MTKACQQGQVEEVHIKSKCEHNILLDSKLLDTIECPTE